MQNHSRLPVLSLASGAVCVGIHCAWEREGDYSGYCQLQSVYGCCARSACLHRRIGVGTHRHTDTHTPCTCTCVDTPYLLFWLQNIRTHNTHTTRSATGLISGPSELGEAFNQGQHTALGIKLIPPSLSLLPSPSLSFFHSLSPHTEQSCWLNISQQHFVPEKLKLDHWRLKIVSHL